jgi:hypothetical protein
MTGPEWDKFRKGRGALLYSEHTTEFQAAIRAVLDGKMPTGGHFIVAKIAPSLEGNPIEYRVWHVTVNRKTRQIVSFMVDTAEDHGRYWRVRGDGRYDHWRTVRK